MKIKLTFLLFLLFVIPACQNISTPIEPEIPAKEMNFLQLPSASSKLYLEEIFTSHKLVNGVIGDTISFKFSYISEAGSEVRIAGQLKIPGGSFDNELDFTILADQAQTFIDFFPSPTEFNKPLELDLTYSGLNLNGIDCDNLEFYYVDNLNNNYQVAEKKIIQCSSTGDELKIIGAKIPHFSRWGVGND